VNRLISAIAALAFCASALAADTPDGAHRTVSRAKYDQVLGRLGLTAEQIKKIDSIYAEYQKKTSGLYKAMRDQNKTMPPADRQAAYKQVREKVAELNAERGEKILEVLTADQKTKYEAAAKIIAEFTEKGKELSKEYATIRKIKDRAKKMEAYKALGKKRRDIYVARDKQLDEKIGKLPKRPVTNEGDPDGPGGKRRPPVSSPNATK
jgi:hypothetical protein